MAATELCEFELRVLRLCAGYEESELSWGAAMGQALEFLRGRGLVEQLNGSWRANAKGLALLEAAAC